MNSQARMFTMFTLFPSDIVIIKNKNLPDKIQTCALCQPPSFFLCLKVTSDISLVAILPVLFSYFLLFLFTGILKTFS